MSEKRLHSPPEQGSAPLGRRIRALVASGAAPLPRPRTPRLEPVRRSWLGATWQARIAVRAGITLDDFLRSRLARYVAALPVTPTRLPLEISEDGRVSVRAAPPPAPTPGGDEGWIAPLVQADGPVAREEANGLDVRLALLDGEIEAARRRVDELSRRFGADVASGLVSSPPAVEATAEQLGRPAIRSAAPRRALLSFAAATLAAHTWQIALPFLHGSGLDPAELAAELGRRPGEVAAALAFALGVSAALFGLVHAGLGAGVALACDGPEARRRRFLALGAAGAAALAVLLALAVAALPRPDGVAGTGPSLALLLVAVPVGAALALRSARRLEEARAVDEADALAWDRERALSLAARARRLEEIDLAEDEQRTLERQRDGARRRLRELSARAVEAGAIAREAREAEQAALARLAQGLVGALELDRWEFVRQATARDALELVSPRRRKGADPRPTIFDAPAVPPGAERVEPGRLAS